MSEQRTGPEPPPIAHARADVDVIAPDGSAIRLLIGDAHRATRASLCEVTLPAGRASRPVWHRQVEEIWYVLDGRGEVWRRPPTGEADAVEPERRVVAVGPGDALTIPTGWRFQFRASPEGALRFLCFTAPPWPGPDEARPSDESGPWPPTV